MGGKREVFVKTPTGYDRREVTLGLFNEKMVEIREGLAEGDEVVINPKVLLAPDDKTKTRDGPGSQERRRRGPTARATIRQGPGPRRRRPEGAGAGGDPTARAARRKAGGKPGGKKGGGDRARGRPAPAAAPGRDRDVRAWVGEPGARPPAAPPPPPLPRPAPSPRVVDLVKNYYMGTQTVYVLKELNLSFDEGDFVALMGPSGSGKSTLLNLLGCLDRPTSGSTSSATRTSPEMDDDQLSEVRSTYLGFIFQSYNLLPQYTVVENIELPLCTRGSSWTSDEAAVRRRWPRWSGWATGSTTGRCSCPAASSSGWPSPAAW